MFIGICIGFCMIILTFENVKPNYFGDTERHPDVSHGKADIDVGEKSKIKAVCEHKTQHRIRQLLQLEK